MLTKICVAANHVRNSFHITGGSGLNSAQTGPLGQGSERGRSRPAPYLVVAQLFTDSEWAALRERLGLSGRQAQVVELLLVGATDKQIGQEMEIAISTVRTYMGRLFEKLDVQDRAELVIRCFREYRLSQSSANDGPH